MDVLRGFITKYHRLTDRRHVKTIRHKQFNMTIDVELARRVKILAAILKVPCYVITEHILQVGSYYIWQALKDPRNREELEKHLVEVHLLGSELTDDEDILRLGG